MAGNDVWGAEREGQDAEQAAIQSNLLNQANNALVTQYGPEAGNPAAAASLQQTNYLSKLDPLLVGQQAVTTGTAQALQPSTIAAGNAQNAGIVQEVPSQVSNAAATAANNTALAQQQTVTANAQVAAQHARATVAAANNAQTYLAANPQDHEGAWQAAIAAANGVAPGEGDAVAKSPQGQQLHQQFLTDPQSAINGMNALVQSGISAMRQTMSPTQWLEFQKSNADLQNVNADRLAKAQTESTAANDNVKQILASSGPTGAGLAQVDGALQSIAKMRSLVTGVDAKGNTVPSISDSTTWNDTIAKHLPGSNMQQLQALAESVRSALSVDMLQGAKAAGSAIGVRASNTEFGAIGDSVAKIDPTMDVKTLKNQIDNAEAAINAYKDGATAMMSGPNGPQEYRQALARKRQTDINLNAQLGVEQPADASTTAPAASPAAPVQPPAGAAGSTPASPQAAASPAGGNVFDTVAQVETGNRNITQTLHDKNMDAGTPGQGYYQIIDPTWKRFAPSVGVDLAKYPSAKDAPKDVQTQVAGVIPASQWGPNSQKAILAKYPGADLNLPLGSIDAHYGPGGVATAPAAGGAPGQLAAMPAPTAAPQAAPNVDPNAGKPAPIASAAPAQGAGGAVSSPGFQAGPVASAAEDPITGNVARAFAGQRSQVMAGRALIAKYLGKAVNA